MEYSTTILLSTYNGEKYLAQQLDSILAQTDQDWSLLIRDDGSSDKTKEIIDQYVSLHPTQIKQLASDKNLGVVNSFGTLLQESDSDYFFFCDQDDVWLPNKIELTKAKMKEEEMNHPESPIAIFTDLRVVDEELQTICNSFWEYSKINPIILSTFDELCVHPAATGCTMMINKKGKECSLPFNDDVRMHDAWIILSILKNDGHINFIKDQTMLYRQHVGNVVGAINENDSYFLNRIKEIKNVIKKNQQQWKMIKRLGFSSLPKYLYLKVTYRHKYNTKHK